MTDEAMNKATHDDYAEALKLLTEGLSGSGYQHDHDEELGMYWYSAQNGERPNTGRDAHEVTRLITALNWQRPPRRG